MSAWLFRDSAATRLAADVLLKESVLRCEALFKLSPGLVLAIDTVGIITDANAGAERMLGYAPGELVGRDFRTLLAGDDSRIEELFVRTTIGEQTRTRLDLVRRDGSKFKLAATGIPLHEGDAVVGALAIGLDVSAIRSEADEEAAHIANLVATLEGMSEGFVAIDTDWKFTYVSAQAERFLRRSRADLLGRVCWDAFEGLAGTAFGTHFKEVALSGEPADVEAYFAPLQAWYSAHVTPSASGLGIYFREVTAEHQQRQALRDAQAQLQRIVETVPAGIIETDAEGRFVFWNGAAAAMLGIPAERVLGKRFDDARWRITDKTGKPLEKGATPLGQVLSTGRPVEAMEIGMDDETGRRLWLSVDARPRLGRNGDVLGIVATFTDVSARVDIEAQVRRSEERYRSLVEQSPEPIVIFAPDGRLVRDNPAARAIWRSATGDGPPGMSYNILRDEGLHRAGASSALERIFKGEAAPLPALQVPFGDQTSRVWVEGFAYPLRDPDGLLREIVFAFSDVSKRVHAEELERNFKSQLEQKVAQRTAELAAANRDLEAFSYSVSHDLRAPVRAIRTLAERLESDSTPADERELTSRILAETLRINNLIEDLLRLSQIGRSDIVRVPIDVASLIGPIVQRLREGDPKRHVRFVNEIRRPIFADPQLLALVFENLLGNAWKYTRDVPDASVTIGESDARDGERVIFIRDNGIGFDATAAPRLFEPFHRLPNAHQFEGTGIGLATVARAIRRQGGRVWAESKIGEGAVFYLGFPEKTEPNVS